MKISFVLGHELPFPPTKGGGVNSLLINLCKGLSGLGHTVTAYSPAAPGRPDIEIVDGIKHVRVKGIDRGVNNLINFFIGTPYALKVKRIMDDTDVLSCHLWHGFLFSKTKKASIVTHTIHRDPKKYLRLFSGFDRIYTGSDSVTADAKKVAPFLESKIKTIYNCVDFDGYPIPAPRAKDGVIRFLYVGRFSRDKGLGAFVPAFIKAAQANPGISFKTIGPITKDGGADETLLQEMQDLVLKNGLADRIQFEKPSYDRKTLDSVIAGCDVIVLPSNGGETLNMSILESLRLGKALLISDLPANSPLNQEGKTGYFVKVDDVADWEKKILEMASDQDKIEAFGLNAYTYGKTTFSCEQIAAQYILDIEALLRLKNGEINGH